MGTCRLEHPTDTQNSQRRLRLEEERRGERVGESFPSNIPHRVGLIINNFQEMASLIRK